jgi:peptide deformylase
VDPRDPSIPQLIADLFETLKEKGIGLAAPQVGILKRVAVIDLGPEHDTPPLALINPEITWCSETQVPFSNGCLSLPKIYAEVTRPEEVTVKYQDPTFSPRFLKASGLLAVCLQHEIDHLNGTLFIDHLSSLKRLSLIHKFKKRRLEQDS